MLYVLRKYKKCVSKYNFYHVKNNKKIVHVNLQTHSEHAIFFLWTKIVQHA